MSTGVEIGEGAVVCDGAAAKPPYHPAAGGGGGAAAAAAGATLWGDITIGPETVVFPGAEIRCCEDAGPVVIGRGCVLEEGARLVNLGPGEMRVGDGNLFEVGCTVQAQQVGVPCFFLCPLSGAEALAGRASVDSRSLCGHDGCCA